MDRDGKPGEHDVEQQNNNNNNNNNKNKNTIINN